MATPTDVGILYDPSGSISFIPERTQSFALEALVRREGCCPATVSPGQAKARGQLMDELSLLVVLSLWCSGKAIFTLHRIRMA